MGWRPHEVYAVTVHEFAAAWDGWSRVHCGPPEHERFATPDDLAELLAHSLEKYGY